MDSRISLPVGYKLTFSGSGPGIAAYTVLREKGRGGTGIVYEAEFINNAGDRRPVIIKECYPYGLHICRDEDMTLIADSRDAAEFDRIKGLFRDSFHLENELNRDDALQNAVSYSIDIYTANDTLYTVFAHTQGNNLKYEEGRPLRELLAIVRNVARRICAIHNKGYLYLDIKPDNIIELDNTDGNVLLFDFDTLYPIFENAGDRRISCSASFAPYEQRTHGAVGTYSDVYSLGALLFYLVYGRTPSSFDCDSWAEYDCIPVQRDRMVYSDLLFRELTGFFHNTLASYPARRYRTMDEAVCCLDSLIAEAARRVFLNSTRIAKQDICLGREEELKALRAWSDSEQESCLFVCGIPGVGKATVVRQFLYSCCDSYDVKLLVTYKGTIRETVNDDIRVPVNAVSRDEAETEEEYWIRKTGKLREYLKNRKSVLVILNDNDLPDTDLAVLKQIFTKIIVTTKRTDYRKNESLYIDTVTDTSLLSEAFVFYLDRDLTEDEKTYAEEIIGSTNGYFMSLYLIARQIACNGISFAEAVKRMTSSGYAHISAGNIDDRVTNPDEIKYDTALSVINTLFRASDLPEEKMTILKVLTMFGTEPASLFFISELEIYGDIIYSGNSIENYSREFRGEAIKELSREGWLISAGDTVCFHPVIFGVVSAWPWTDKAKSKLNRALDVAYIKLYTEVHRSETPAAMMKTANTLRRFGPEAMDNYLKICSRHGLAGELAANMVCDCSINCYPSIDSIRRIQRNVTSILNSADGILNDWNEAHYRRLINVSLRYCLREERGKIMPKLAGLLTGSDLSCEPPFLLYSFTENVMKEYLELGNYGEAYKFLEIYHKYSENKKSCIATGLYNSLRAEYYDSHLDGRYSSGAEHDKADYAALIASLEMSIDNLGRKRYTADYVANYGTVYGMDLISLAICIMRHDVANAEKNKVLSILRKAEKFTSKCYLDYSPLWVVYYMAMGWYHTFYEPDLKIAMEYVEKATRKKMISMMSELDLIDECIIPGANMCLELGFEKESVDKLEYGLGVCGAYRAVKGDYPEPYKRKSRELLEHLCNVYEYFGDDENYNRTLRLINRYNSADIQ